MDDIAKGHHNPKINCRLRWRALSLYIVQLPRSWWLNDIPKERHTPEMNYRLVAIRSNVEETSAVAAGSEVQLEATR